MPYSMFECHTPQSTTGEIFFTRSRARKRTSGGVSTRERNATLKGLTGPTLLVLATVARVLRVFSKCLSLATDRPFPGGSR